MASKVHFTKNVEELEKYVERSHIIKELGGDDPWEYQYAEPVAGENNAMSDDGPKQKLLDERATTVRDFEVATQRWISTSQTRAETHQKRSDLAEQLRAGYWQLDPYLRARTLYDRTGLIRTGGIIQYYAPSINANAPKPIAISAQNGVPVAEHRADDVD